MQIPRNMRRSVLGFASSLLLALSVVVWSGTQAKEPWGLPPSATQGDVDSVLDVLAELPSLRSSELDGILTQLGFKSELSKADWEAFSEKEKLQIAYRWAKAADTQSSSANSRAFIVAVARTLESKYESLAFDQSFSGVFFPNGSPSQPPRVAFTRPTRAALVAALPDETVKALDILSIYVEGAGPLSRGNVARTYFQLTGQSLEEALAKREPKQFLRGAARRAPVPPPVQQRVNALIEEVLRQSDAAAIDPGLAKVRADLRRRFGDIPKDRPAVAELQVIDEDGHLRSPEAATGPTLGGGGGGGGHPQRATAAAERHTRLDREFYRTPGARSFRSVLVRAGGRGGVIAGAPFKVDPALSKPVSIAIGIPEGTKCAGAGQEQTKGTITVKTRDRSLTYPNVNCDVLIAAKRLVYDENGIGRWKVGEAIGLASIDTTSRDDTFPFFIPKNADATKIGARKRMLLHPAVVDLEVGRALGLVDMLPSADAFIARVTKGDRAVIAWLRGMRSAGASTWKWSDSPSTISQDAGMLRVNPTQSTILLAFRVFSERDLDKEEEICSEADAARCEDELVRKQVVSGSDMKQFDLAARTLMRQVTEMERVEELLRTLVVFRWARINGARFDGREPPLPVPRRATPDSIVVGVLSDWIAGAPNPISWKADCLVFFERLADARARQERERDVLLKERQRLALEDIPERESSGDMCERSNSD